MDRVTDETHAFHDPMMEEEKGTRFARWKEGLVARSHVLTKLVGDTISATWNVTNTGGGSAQGAIDIVFLPSGNGFFGNLVNIVPGQTILLSVSGVITALVPGTTYQAEVRIRAALPATVAPGGVHSFTVTIPSPVGAILTAGVGPTII